MKIDALVFRVLQVVIILVILGVVGLVAFFIFNLDADKQISDAARKADILRMQTNAQIYFARLQYYDGVCADIGADSERVCHETETAFAIETRLNDGTFYCADSTGNPPSVSIGSKGTRTVCN